MSDPNGEPYIKTRTALQVAGTIMLGLIAFIAQRTYVQLDELAKDMREVASQVIVSQTMLSSHEKRLDKLETDLYLPSQRPNSQKP